MSTLAKVVLLEILDRKWRTGADKGRLENAACSEKVLGLFRPGGKTVEIFRVNPLIPYPAYEPTLPEMTAVALEILSRDKEGFFLLVEGSQVDWRNHARDIKGMIAETLAFEESVRVVIE